MWDTTTDSHALEATRPLRAFRSRHHATGADRAGLRQSWLIATVCGLFGLSVLMLAVVLNTPRPVDRISGPGALPPPTAATTTMPVPAPRPAPPATRPESGPRETARTGDDDPATGEQARDLAERYVPEIASGLPGLPGR